MFFKSKCIFDLLGFLDFLYWRSILFATSIVFSETDLWIILIHFFFLCGCAYLKGEIYMLIKKKKYLNSSRSFFYVGNFSTIESSLLLRKKFYILPHMWIIHNLCVFMSGVFLVTVTPNFFTVIWFTYVVKCKISSSAKERIQ